MTAPEIVDGLRELTAISDAFMTGRLHEHLATLGDRIPEVGRDLELMLAGVPDSPERRRLLRAFRDLVGRHRAAVSALSKLDDQAKTVAGDALALLGRLDEGHDDE